MSAKIVVSGNQQKIPTEVSVKTSSYTIPAGKYARVVVECHSGGVFTINGSDAITTSGFISVNSATFNSTVSYTVPQGYKFNLTGTFSTNDNPTNDLNRHRGSVIGSGTTLYAMGQTQTNRIRGVLEPSNGTHKEAEFILPSGTVISGSGTWRAVVEEYEE